MCIDGKVVVWKSEEHGWGRKRKHCEVTATLYEHWLYSSAHDSGIWAAYGAPYGANESRPREPVLCGEVCPPGHHLLTRGMDTPCLRFGLPHCRGMLTHRCTRCPWWRCADDSCTGAAWDNSSGLVDRWNQEAGVTRSSILDPVRTEEMG